MPLLSRIAAAGAAALSDSRISRSRCAEQVAALYPAHCCRQGRNAPVRPSRSGGRWQACPAGGMAPMVRGCSPWTKTTPPPSPPPSTRGREGCGGGAATPVPSANRREGAGRRQDDHWAVAWCPEDGRRARSRRALALRPPRRGTLPGWLGGRRCWLVRQRRPASGPDGAATTPRNLRVPKGGGLVMHRLGACEAGAGARLGQAVQPPPSALGPRRQ